MESKKSSMIRKRKRKKITQQGKEIIVNRFKKVITRMLMAICVMAGMAGSVVSVSAANVSDTEYKIYVNASSGTFRKEKARDKQNNTKVYVHITESPTKYTQTRVYGDRNTESIFYNETKGGLAKVLRNQKSSITNYIYEFRIPDTPTVLAKIGFRSNSSKTGYVSGVWSPDSTRNYTVVN